MWGGLLVLVIWAFDRELLVKLRSAIVSTLKTLAWKALTLYANWRPRVKTEKAALTISDHQVNQVYLIETFGPQKCRIIDAIEAFAQHIDSNLITNTNSMPLIYFVDRYFSSMFSQRDVNAKYSLLVCYTFDRKKYAIVYDENTKTIRFPIYSGEQARSAVKRQPSIVEAWKDNANNVSNTINLFAEQLKAFAGPRNNFYADTEYSVHRDHLNISNNAGVYPDSSIHLMNAFGDVKVIDPEIETISDLFRDDTNNDM